VLEGQALTCVGMRWRGSRWWSGRWPGQTIVGGEEVAEEGQGALAVLLVVVVGPEDNEG
jgi:hypothetical protein